MNSSSNGAMTACMDSCCCIFVLPLHTTCGKVWLLHFQRGVVQQFAKILCVYGLKSIPCFSFGSGNGDSIAFFSGRWLADCKIRQGERVVKQVLFYNHCYVLLFRVLVGAIHTCPRRFYLTRTVVGASHSKQPMSTRLPERRQLPARSF